jgi:uncharacterized membrane protein
MSTLATLCAPPPASDWKIDTSQITISTAEYIAQLQSEYTGICTSLNGIAPKSFIEEIQSILRFMNVKPTANAVAIEEFLIPTIFLAIITFTIGLILSAFTSNWKLILGITMVALIIWYVVYKTTESFENPIPKLHEGFQISPVPESDDQHTLVNIQPAAQKQIAYVGPNPRGGKFDPMTGISNVLGGGVRFFVVQIDYLDSDPKTPILIYRDKRRNKISTNTCSIADVAKALNTYAFNPQFPAGVQPLILYLHFVRTPNHITAPDAYVKFLGAVAEAMKSIQPLVLQREGDIVFSRQQSEKILLYTPMQTFEKKVLLFTNVDTSLFRNALTLGLTPVSSVQDLDLLVCMRVHLDDPTDPVGATVPDTTSNAAILSYSRLKKMKSAQQQAFAQKGKTRFTIAMPDSEKDPSLDEIVNIMSHTGVNVIPTSLFGTVQQDILPSLKPWAKTPFYMLKPPALVSVKTATVGHSPSPSA